MSIFNKLLGDNPPNYRRRTNSDGGSNFDDDNDDDNDNDGDSGDSGGDSGGDGGD